MKNAVEIRAPFNGIIKNHFFKVGDNVNCNTELFEIEQNDTVVNVKKDDSNTKKEVVKESNKTEVKSKSVEIDTSKNINNNIFEPKVESMDISTNTKNTTKNNIMNVNTNERMIFSEPMSSFRHLINEKMKFIQNEKAVLSTFNEVRINKIIG